MEKEIHELLKDSLEKLSSVTKKEDLEKLYVEIFGRTSKLQSLTKKISRIPKESRSKAGKAINGAKKELEAMFEETKVKTQKQESEKKTQVDITAPGKKQEIGSLHLVSQAIEEITNIFSKIGFYLQSYPEIDWDYYAFESLNMPKGHPARDDWETFFVSQKKDPKYGKLVLTPHTSNGQVREMEKTKPPIRMINISRCYRRQIDVSHTPMFHQFEGLLIDKDINISHLKGITDYFTQNFFGPKRLTRLRPHHFRFTEPSFEVDVTCGVCMGKGCRLCKSGWLELGGAGMVHPNVLKAGKVDPEIYSGFAFGWGIERTIAMKTSLPDIRLLYQNDIRFLEQF